MRILRLRNIISALAVAPFALGGLFGDSETTGLSSSGSGSSSSSSSLSDSMGSSSSSSSTSGVSQVVQVNTPEVAFLLSLQHAQITSMSCLITLYNMTTTPIGTCLNLGALIPMIVGTDVNGVQADGRNGLFSDQLTTYLDTTCSSGTCTQADITEAQAQMANNCQGQDVDLVRVLTTVLANYQSSYFTLACMIRYNGTTDNCLPSVLSSNPVANTCTFFNNLVSGHDLEQYNDSVFNLAQCTGCMYEMFKAAVFVFSTIRGQSVTNTIGNHLQTCPNTGQPNWPDVQDQQIPSSLQVNQNVNQGADPESSSSSGTSGSSLGSSDTSSSSSSSGSFSSGATSLDVDWARVYLGVAGVVIVRIGLMAMFDDPTDLSLCIV